MLTLYDREISESESLFREDFFDGWKDRWEITGGKWSAQNGVLDGLFRGNAGGLIYTNAQFPGDIILDFYGSLVAPCCNDLNFTFRAKGWDYKKGDAAQGYIAGLNGWWKKRVGIERYPDCKLVAMSGAFTAEPGREYHIQTGIAQDLAFVAVDGELVVLLRDPNPICEEGSSRVGLGTYCSHARFRNFKIFRAVSKPAQLSYVPQF